MCSNPFVACLVPALVIVGSGISHAQSTERPQAPRPGIACLADPPLRQLTSKGRYMAPRWSPDGNWIAMTEAGFRGIHVVRPDGTGLRKLTGDQGAGYRFAWSPDATRIAYQSRREISGHTLKVASVVNVADGSIRTLAEPGTEVGIPVWLTPDSIAFTAGARIVVARLDGRVDERACADIAHLLAWRRGGGSYLYVEHGDDQDRVVLVSTDERKTYLTAAKDGRFVDVAISPRDDRALVHSMDGHIHIIDFESRTRRDLGEGSGAVWSPDGKQILCSVTRDDGHEITQSELVLIDVDTGARTQLTDTPDALEMFADFSPDGRRIVYCDSRTDAVYVRPTAR